MVDVAPLVGGRLDVAGGVIGEGADVALGVGHAGEPGRAVVGVLGQGRHPVAAGGDAAGVAGALAGPGGDEVAGRVHGQPGVAWPLVV